MNEQQNGVTYDPFQAPAPINSSKINSDHLNNLVAQLKDNQNELELQSRERQKAENALILSEERFRHVFEYASMGIGLTSLVGTIIDVNSAFSDFIGYSKKQLIGMNVMDITHPDDRDLTRQRVDNIRKGSPFLRKVEKRYIHKNGSILWAVARISVVCDAQGNSLFAFGMLQDITEKKRLAAELIEVKEQVEIQERKRLASTIHDGVIQNLNAVLLSMKKKSEYIKNSRPSDSIMLEEANQDISKIIKQLRDISMDLHPDFLDRMELHEAISWQCNKLMQQSGIEIETTIGKRARKLPDIVKRNSFLLMQEVVTNAIKHAGCKKIDVLLEKRKNNILLLQISDNGKGYNHKKVQKLAQNGIGLSIIEDRVKRVNGTCHVDSEIGKGTNVTFRIPCHD
ncbi:MAG: PAS domain S-box protein [Magnetococcales bacterium]|nr:PAS domain S-box protein [Magnetococcales bacterium]